MFNKEYSFRGSHAEKVMQLTAQFDSTSSAKLFYRNIDVYLIAPIIGFLYGRKANIDKTSDSTTKIFPQQLTNELTNLRYNYQLIVLLDAVNENSFDERLNKAFRYYDSEESKEDEALYEQYVLGGVDILYEKLIENASTSEDYIEKLYDFLEEFDERYNQAITSDSIIELCNLAR